MDEDNWQTAQLIQHANALRACEARWLDPWIDDDGICEDDEDDGGIEEEQKNG